MNSIISYPVDSETTFGLPFVGGVLSKTHVQAWVLKADLTEVQLDLSGAVWLPATGTPTSITLAAPVDVEDAVTLEFRRITPRTPIVDFTLRGRLTEHNLDMATKQATLIAGEVEDNISKTVVEDVQAMIEQLIEFTLAGLADTFDDEVAAAEAARIAAQTAEANAEAAAATAAADTSAALTATVQALVDEAEGYRDDAAASETAAAGSASAASGSASAAASSASAAAASAAAAAGAVLGTALTGFSAGSNTAITASDTVKQGFEKAQGQISARLPLAGGTLTGALTLAADGSSALHAVTKQQLDAAQIVLLTAQATTSGSSKSWTIPSGTKRIKFMGIGISGSVDADFLVRLGGQTTGYVGQSALIGTAGNVGSGVNPGSGFEVPYSAGAANAHDFDLTLSLVDSATNAWVCSGFVWHSGQFLGHVMGHVTLTGGAPTTITFLTTSGTLDAGTANVSYEI